MKSALYFALLGLFLFSCKNSPETLTPEPGYLIAFNTYEPDSVVEDNWEIRIMDPEDSTHHSTNIINHPDVAWTYFAHGPTIYFISDRDTAYRHFFLYQMDSEGKNIQKLSNLRLEDSWMDLDPTTQTMIVSGRTENRYQLYLIDLKTGNYTPFIHDTAFKFQDPVFSPDGKQVAYVKSPKVQEKGIFPEVFLINRNGSGEKQLTKFPANDPAAEKYGYKAGALKWHPTENFISYASSRGNTTSIFGVRPEGGESWKLFPSENREVYHSWSPDGKLLTFEQSEPDSASKGYKLILMNWETKEFQDISDPAFKTQLAPVFVQKN